MITEKEIESVSLSPTKKDFYQIWNELLETAEKISNRWAPWSATETNESDPGIILLKVLSALGDKLNYTIDKNILEAFMPSATQQESMRKLCDMMGYNIKYYQSAVTDVTIKYTGSVWPESKKIIIPRFSTLTDTDNTLSYITNKEITFTPKDGDTKAFTTDVVECIEGQFVECENEANNNNLITAAQMDDNYRYYLPETQIAENGIFIFSNTISISGDTTTIKQGIEWTKVDNLNTQPLGSYVYKFGYDSKLNIPYLQFPNDVSSLIEDGLKIYYIRTNGINGNVSAYIISKLEKPDIWESTSLVSIENFIVQNTSASYNGTNPETINDAYNNYKKVIGTFDTLVTCRDYMNKIYQLTEDNVNQTPLVSNIIVSDIRDDINRSYTLCEFNEYGIKYTDRVIKKDNKDLIDHFDIILYPFKTITANNSKDAYDSSFTYSEENSLDIEEQLEQYKTISHKIKYPSHVDDDTEIACIKNYLKLNAKITTNYKVNSIEETSILNSIYNNIYNTFNLRKLDFGEAIPYDDIYNCILNADSRIKNVSLDEPELYTKFMLADNREYWVGCGDAANEKVARITYNKLALRNILAGKIALFNYNEDFQYNYTDKEYDDNNIKPIYPDPETKEGALVRIKPGFEIGIKLDGKTVVASVPGDITLKENEVIQFRAPSFKTELTYPAYVNYYLKLKSTTATEGVGAAFTTLGLYLTDKWDDLYTQLKYKMIPLDISDEDTFNKELIFYGAIWDKDYKRIYAYNSEKKPFSVIPITIDTYPTLYKFIKEKSYDGIYRRLGWSAENIPGTLVDANQIKYQKCTTFVIMSNPLNDYFVRETTGTDAEVPKIAKGTDYKLTDNELLLINYTQTSDSEDSTSTDLVINKVWPAGTIIRPNFDIFDSAYNHSINKINYSKTSGFTFESTIQPEGMYTLGTSEQIEIRNTTGFDLGKVEEETTNSNTDTYEPVYIYWSLQEEDKLKEANTGIIKFPWKTRTIGNTEEEYYELQQNEYFYFTDDAKLSMSYYGNGTEIIKTGNINIDKPKECTTTKTTEELISAGINGISWWKLTPTESDHISFKEYQYINLVENDTLIKTEADTNTSTIRHIDKDWQSLTPSEISAVEYKLQNAEASSKLPIIKVGENSWEIRSILQVNMGPTTTQTLHSNVISQNNEKVYQTRDYIELYCLDSKGKEPTKPTTTLEAKEINNVYKPLTLKANYLCQSSSDDINTRVLKEDVATGELVEINDFKIKTLEYEDLKIKVGTTETAISTHNFGNYWTKLTMSSFKEGTTKGSATFNVQLPNDSCYGLVMVYLVPTDLTTITDRPYITVSKSTAPVIFNYYSSSTTSNESWWKDYTSTDTTIKYYLKDGINVIKFKKSNTFTLYPDSTCKANIILTDLDIVDIKGGNDPDEGLNLTVLKYQDPYSETVTTNRIATQLLSDIRALDDAGTFADNHKFYYNARIENSDAIDLNTALDIEGNPIETLSSETAWYDYNNVNNKFVVSEIDSTYMKKYGISIARSSKRTY